jgi:L-asparaginase II
LCWRPANTQHPAIGIAVKVADGNFRALYPVVVAVLRKFRILNDDQMEKLAYYAHTPLKNHRKNEIGYIKSLV